MQVLILQFVDPRQSSPRKVFSHHLGTLAAMLRNEGIGIALAALPGNRSNLLRQAVQTHKPRAVLVEMRAGSISAAHRTICEVGQQLQLPVVVCGPYATCRPEQAISIPGARALLLGEYEVAAVELLKAWRDGQDGAGLPGVWVHTATGLAKGDVRPPAADLDALPCPDRELFDGQLAARETGEASFMATRGCARWCGHCVNDWYTDLYEEAAYLRRRSVTNVLDEIHSVVSRYPAVELVNMLDHGLLADAEWFAEFAAAYPRRCSVPYRCHVPAELATPELVATLRASLCREAIVRIGSGSRFIREEILAMYVTNEQILQACQTLRSGGIRVRAEVFVGCPYESEITLEETLSLLRQAGADEVRPRVFFPVPGSRAEELCIENGWISGRSEEGYWTGRSVLDMPSIPPAHIDAFAERFEQLLRQPGGTSLRKVLDRVSNRRKGVWRLLGGLKL